MIAALSAPARGHLAMLLLSALVAGSFSFGTRMAGMMEPAGLMALRFLLAGVIVGALIWVGPGLRRAYYSASWRYLLLGGLLGGYFVLMFEGFKTAPAVSASAVLTLLPLMSAFFGFLLLGHRVDRRMFVALLIGATGAVWVIFDGRIDRLLGFDIGRGEAIYFLGCVLHAVYTPLTRRLNRGEPVLAFTFGIVCGGSVILWVSGFPDLVATDWAELPPLFWSGLVYLAVFPSAGTFLLLIFASRHLPSGKVMAYTYLTPSWVLLLELILTGSVPNPAIYIGVVATIISLLLLLRD